MFGTRFQNDMSESGLKHYFQIQLIHPADLASHENILTLHILATIYDQGQYK